MSVTLEVADRNQWRVLTLKGRVDAFADKRVIMNIRQSAPSEKAWVVMDLRACEFLSIWALKSIENWKNDLKKSGGRMVVMSPSDAIHRQLDVFLGKGIEIYDSWESLEVKVFYEQVRKSFGVTEEPDRPAYMTLKNFLSATSFIEPSAGSTTELSTASRSADEQRVIGASADS